jgi:hypothetical protein
MSRRFFQLLGCLLIFILLAAAAAMVNMAEYEIAIGLSCSAAFTTFVIYYFGRMLDN